MVPVSLHVPDSVPKDFLNTAASLVQLVPVLTEPYALFDRTDSCACSTRHGLAIQGRSILVRQGQHAVVGYPLYALPPDCTFEETFVIVTWLLRHRMKTFQSTIVEGGPYSKPFTHKQTLKRTQGTQHLFQKTPYGACCERYTLQKDPVFMLSSMVLSPYGQAHLHALRYAVEMTKVFLMDRYQKRFPHLFQYATLETRPATPQDYYIPSTLASKAIVVVRTYFEETACQRLSCFPFKDNWEMCTEQDSPQWVPIGQQFEMACQPACQDHNMNTEWVRGRCILANPMKKVLATIPEKLFERASRHIYHGGLDVVEGTLKLNARYCEAYGLEFADEDCYAPGGQAFLEWLLGKTTIRSIKTASLVKFTSHPPANPVYLNYQHPQKRKTRSVGSIDPTHHKVYREIAVELATELGEEVSEWAIERFLRKKAPQLLTVSMNTLAVKLVIKHSVRMSIQRVGTSLLKTLGKGFASATAVYALYDTLIGILDVLDMCDFNKVLDKKTLNQMDRELDYTYFKEGVVRPEVTPEFLWDNEILTQDEDESEKFQFMVDRVEEYLTALYTVAPSSKELKKANLKFFEWKKDDQVWSRKIFTSLLVVLVCCVILFIEYVDVWANCLFFMKLYFGF